MIRLTGYLIILLELQLLIVYTAYQFFKFCIYLVIDTKGKQAILVRINQ